MESFQASSYIVGILAGIGVLAAGLGFAYAQFRSGSDRLKDSLINDLKEKLRLEQEKNVSLTEEKGTLIISHQKQITDLTQKVGKLEGLNESNEKKLDEYKAIFQNRNPELEGFLQENSLILKTISTHMNTTNSVLEEVKIMLRHLNTTSTSTEVTTKTVVPQLSPSGGEI